MQFRDLKTQYQKLKPEIDAAIMQVATECNFISGKQVAEFEERLAEYVGVKHCITCANGTDALSLAVMAHGISEGDAVFVPDFTFFSSGEIVSLAGAVPVFVDVKKDTYNIDVVALERQIKSVIEDGRLTPKAIIAVDLFGLPAEYDFLREIADRYDLALIEDGAQGFGGNIRGKKACCFGDISTTSFFPAKPLGCYGDGGAVFTDDDEIADILRSLKIHGKGDSKYDNVRIGMNSRLDTIQAAVLKVKLKAFEEYELDDVNAAADKYSCLLEELVRDDGSGLTAIPFVSDGYLSSWAQYTVQFRDKALRDSVQALLKENDIPSMIYYQKPMHRQDAFKRERELYKSFYEDGIFSNTLELCDTVLSLPIHPYITEEDIELVCGIIKSACRKG